MVYGIGCNNGYCVNNNEQFGVINNNNNDKLNKYVNSPMARPYNPNIQKPVENYGKAILLLNKTAEKLEPSELIFDPSQNDIEAIKGERIYGSDGKLVAIVDNNDENKTVYTLNEDNESLIDNIKVTNNKTGKTVKEQYITTEDNGDIYIDIKDNLENNRTKYTNYKNGELEAVSIYKDGNKMHTSIFKDLKYSYIDYTERQETPNGYIENSVLLENNSVEATISNKTQINNKAFSKRLKFNNGALINMKSNQDTTVPNTIGLKEISDKHLEPTSEFNIKGIKDTLKDVDGIRTHYSNGKLESIEGKLNGKGIIANFDINGELKKVLFEKVTVEILNDGEQKITETLEDGSKKTTAYFKDSVDVTLEKDKIEKRIFIEKNNILRYHETTKLENGKEKEKAMFFNKNGFVEDCYEYERD